MNQNSSTYCTEPYKQVHFDSQGNLGPCCQYVGERDKSINSIDEYWDSQNLKDIRTALDNSVQLDGCKFCWKAEAEGAESMRQRRNRYYEQRPDTNIDHIMITFGNQCNTACRICNASRSSLIEKQYKESCKTVNEYDLLKLITNLPKFDKSKTWYRSIVDNIVDRTGNLRKLEISGGEPFINVHYNRMIDKMIAKDVELPIISITTNGSFEREQIEKLNKFDHTHINFSIDSVGNKLYNHLRWPLKWNDTIEKILILVADPDLTCEFVIVPHNLNILNLADSVLMLKNMTNWDPRFKVGFSWLNGAPWYALNNSPKWTRDKAVNQLTEVLDAYQFTEQETQQLIELINILQIDAEPTHLNMLKTHVEMTDRYRGCNTWDTIGWKFDDITS